MLPKTQQFFIQHHTEIASLAQKFSSYPANITITSVQSYLNQFKDDIELGLKLLNNVSYYDPTSMVDLTRSLGNTIKSINKNTFKDVIFCPLSTSIGNSSDAILRYLRVTMGGTPARQELFKNNFLSNVTELRRKIYRESNTYKRIVFIDHFIGSGDSIIRTWGGIQQWENPKHEYCVGVLVGYKDAMKYVEEETDSRLKLIPIIELLESARAFHPSNSIFSKNEKAKLMEYCDGLGITERDKYGYKNGQSLVVFSNRVSDNVLPILHHKTDQWNPLFPRNY